MKASRKIKALILNDNAFSLELSNVMNIQQMSLRQLVKRNSSKLTLYQCVLFYKKKGFTEDEIFEKEEVK